MTEQELQDEAYKYAILRTYPRFENNYIANFVLKEVEGSYFAGAKEREERIAELEKKIKDLKSELELEQKNKTKHKYKATFGFNDVVAFRKALKVHKAILEAQSESEFAFGNDDYKKACKALESVERHL